MLPSFSLADPCCAVEQLLERLDGLADALARKYGIPPGFELHTSPFLHGKFEPLPPFLQKGQMIDAKVNNSAGVQREVVERTLDIMGRLPGARIITCARSDTDRKAAYTQLLETIGRFLQDLDRNLSSRMRRSVSGFSERPRRCRAC